MSMISKALLNKKMKSKQNQVIAGVGAGVVVLVVGAIMFMGGAKHHAKAAQKLDLTGAVSEDFTKANTQSAVESEQQRLDKLADSISEIKKMMQAQGHQNSKLASSNSTTIKALNIELQRLKNQPRIIKQVVQNKAKGHASHPGGLSYAGALGEGAMPQSMGLVNQGITTTSFNYTRTKRDVFSPKNYVPTGTFVRAVIIGGADANASVSGQSSTSPLLMRIIASGTLPNGKHSSLKGCFALGSVYGDISSERGQVTLTNISCTKANGQVIDKPIKGWAFGIHGLEGVRGKPIMRNGKILFNAGAAGFLSGFGKAFQQASETVNQTALGSTSTVSPNQALRFGAYGGAGTAAEKLADYYIKLAEQYHPVIEIRAGNMVDLVFAKGFSLTPLAGDSVKSANTTAAKPATNHQGTKIDTASLIEEIKHSELGQTIGRNS